MNSVAVIRVSVKTGVGWEQIDSSPRVECLCSCTRVPYDFCGCSHVAISGTSLEVRTLCDDINFSNNSIIEVGL